MTLVPTVLVLIVGSELIRTNIDRWFNAPDGRHPVVGQTRKKKNIASDYYHEAAELLASDSRQPGSRGDAGARGSILANGRTLRPIRDLLAPDVHAAARPRWWKVCTAWCRPREIASPSPWSR